MNKICCEELTSHSENIGLNFTYYNKFREFGIYYKDSESFQLIKYCPWCGSKLPSSLRDEWFNYLDKMGYEPEDPRLPKEYLSDKWWLSNKDK